MIGLTCAPLSRTMPRRAPPGAEAIAAIVSSRSSDIAPYRFCFCFFVETGLLLPLGLAGLAGRVAVAPSPLAPPAGFFFIQARNLRSQMPHALETMKYRQRPAG